MPLVYLVRHGQTEYNSEHIIQGRCDSPLTELGRAQAEATALELKNYNFSKCYYSPLGRTIATSEILLQYHDIDKAPVDDLMEVDLGTWEGLKIDPENLKLKDFHHFWKTPTKYTGESNNGEDYDTLAERVYNCLQKIVDSHHRNDVLLIVSHGAAIRSFINPLAGRKRDDFWSDPQTEPASVSIVKWDEGKKPELLSYSGHDVTTIPH